MLIGYLLLMAALYGCAAIHFGSFTAAGVASMGGGLLGISMVEVREKISKGFESVLTSIPVGIFLVVLGMEVNLRETGNYFNFVSVLALVVVGTKVAGYQIATRRMFNSWRERAFILFGGLSQGETGMLIAAYLFSRGILNGPVFNSTVIVVIMLTMLIPILTKVGSQEFGVKTEGT